MRVREKMNPVVAFNKMWITENARTCCGLSDFSQSGSLSVIKRGGGGERTEDMQLNLTSATQTHKPNLLPLLCPTVEHATGDHYLWDGT